MTELAAPQISSLMEALPGIAAVLRSPVASAMASLVRAGAGLEEFSLNDAEELLRFGVRRNLLTQEEVDRLLDEAREVVARRPAKPGAAADAGAKAPKAKVPPPLAAPLTVTSAPARQASVVVPARVATPAPKPVAKVAKVAPPAVAKAAPKVAAQTHKTVAAKKAPAKGSAGKGSANKSTAKPVHKAKPVAKAFKAATKKAPAKAPAKAHTKAPAKKVPAKGAKKRR